MAFTLNGFGTGYFGRRWQPDGTYITTKWVVIFFVPLIPLGSVRVLEGSLGGNDPFSVGFGSAKIMRVPLDTGVVARMYGLVIGIALFLFFGVPILNNLVDKFF
jgi:hypothetical protein